MFFSLKGFEGTGNIADSEELHYAVIGSKLVTMESQLATARYQNQGLKALLSRIEGKHETASKQLATEKSVSE